MTATSFVRRCGHAGALWADRLAYSLMGQWATKGDPALMRCLGQYVPLTTPWSPRPTEQLGAADRAVHLLAWTRSGVLTYGEAELLMVLDESTSWQAPA